MFICLLRECYIFNNYKKLTKTGTDSKKQGKIFPSRNSAVCRINNEKTEKCQLKIEWTTTSEAPLLSET